MSPFLAPLLDRDGEVFLLEGFIPRDEADSCLARLLHELAFAEETLIIAGREVKVPRRVAWYGDPGACYRYSGIDHLPLPWTDTLRVLKLRVEEACGHAFNSVLANLYRNGNDSMGWHADKERELGPNPFIASLSFGATRSFRLRHDKTGETLALPLSHGDLLLMGGRLQHHWRHCVPKAREAQSPRINLTFRTIRGAG
jgi:alkylated DNA repair dioxygenase AlkB